MQHVDDNIVDHAAQSVGGDEHVAGPPVAADHHVEGGHQSRPQSLDLLTRPVPHNIQELDLLYLIGKNLTLVSPSCY